jgi:hypothetical protein
MDGEVDEMYYTCWSYRLWGAVVLCTGLFVIWRGWKLWHRPESLRPGTWMYRIYNAWLRGWQRWIYREEDHPHPLTARQIQFLAAMNVVSGVLFVLMGITAVLLG